MLSGVIYVHHISDTLSTKVPSRNFMMVRALCGDAALMNAVLVSNMWSKVSPEVGGKRENELSSGFFKPALDLGAQMARHDNTAQSAHNIIRRIATNAPVVLQIQRELVVERKDIANTTAGISISKKLNRKIGELWVKLEKVRKETEQALKEKEEETVRGLQKKGKRLQGQVEKFVKDEEGMAANYAAEKRRMEAMMTEMEQNRERDALERRRHSADPTRRPQDGDNMYVADRARLVKRPQDLVGIPGTTSPGELTCHVTSPSPIVPQTPLRTSSPQMPSRPTPYVWASFCLAAHGS